MTQGLTSSTTQPFAVSRYGFSSPPPGRKPFLSGQGVPELAAVGIEPTALFILPPSSIEHEQVALPSPDLPAFAMGDAHAKGDHDKGFPPLALRVHNPASRLALTFSQAALLREW